METPTQTLGSSKTSPKDFFLWLGAVIALYGSIASFITLLFEYINYSFPDDLAGYGDPYGGAVRFGMAALMVMVPTLIVLFYFIRASIEQEAGKAQIWVRRWAIVLTLFIAAVTVLIDLITLIHTFLGGEISTRFGLKILVVLLVALGVFLHFLADQRGYWIVHRKKANMIGIAVGLLTFVTVVSGFFIVGTPNHVRMLRFDEQKVQDLQTIQYQVVQYWQMKRVLPSEAVALVDALGEFTLPVDPQTNAPYEYKATGALSFELCALFNEPTPDSAGRGAYAARDIAYPSMGGGMNENWQHRAGTVCFTRTIDPERYQTQPLLRDKGN